MTWPSIGGAVVTMTLAMGCSEPPSPEVPPLGITQEATGPQRRFAFPTLDGGVATSGGYRGRMTVVAMIATYDAASQAQARFLQSVYRRHAPRINALLLALEPRDHLPLVDAFASTLRLSYDVALADAATIAGEGPFPGLHHVPSVILLDRRGREVWRHLGLVDAETLDRVIADHDDQARD